MKLKNLTQSEIKSFCEYYGIEQNEIEEYVEDCYNGFDEAYNEFLCSKITGKVLEARFIDHSFETGTAYDIETHFFVNGNSVYKVVGTENDFTVIEKVNKRTFKKDFGVNWGEIKKRFIKNDDTFIPIENEACEDYGFYNENDHEELIECGCFSEYLAIKE